MGAALVGDQRQTMAFAEQRLGQRFRRKDMTAGAAGGEDDQTLAAVTRDDHMARPSGSRRRRVRAMIMPMPTPNASSDDPP